jgi:hypothetical protein
MLSELRLPRSQRGHPCLDETTDLSLKSVVHDHAQRLVRGKLGTDLLQFRRLFFQSGGESVNLLPLSGNGGLFLLISSPATAGSE